MAETRWVPVAGQAMRLGLGLYVVPLAFVANPALLYPGADLGLAMLAFTKVAVGLWLMSRALIGGKAPAWTAPLFLLVGLAAIFAVGVDPQFSQE